jgi:hypothetical protein
VYLLLGKHGAGATFLDYFHLLSRGVSTLLMVIMSLTSAQKQVYSQTTGELDIELLYKRAIKKLTAKKKRTD